MMWPSRGRRESSADPKRLTGRVIRHGGTEPTLLLGQTRSGKGQTLAHTMLEWEGPIYCVDPKGGELYRMLAGELADRRFKVARIDPTSQDPGVLRWNPLLEVERGQREVTDTFRVIESLTEGQPGESMTGTSRHFRDRASGVMVGLGLHCLYRQGPPGGIGDVLDQVTQVGGDAKNSFRRIAEYPHNAKGHFAWSPPGELGGRTHPQVKRLMLGAVQTADQELLSVLSTIQGQLKAWFDEGIRESTRFSTFSFRQAAREKGKLAVFVTLPALDLDILAGYLRCFIYFFERTFGPRPGHQDHAVAADRQRVLFVVDEMPQLGRSKSIPRILSLGGGAGIVTIVTAQSLSQLRSVYGRDEPISGGCPVWWVSAPEDTVLLRELEAKLGPTTVAKTEVSHTAAKRGSATFRVSEQRRPLLTQGELRTLARDQALVLGPGLHPMLVHKRLAFETAELDGALGREVPTKAPDLSDPECPWQEIRRSAA